MAVALEPKRTYRRSEIQSMLTCPAYRPSHSDRASFGTVIHAFMAAYWQRCRMAGEEEMLHEVHRIAHDAFFRRARGIDPGRWPEALELCQRFAQNRLAELGSLIDVEQTLTVDVGWCFVNGTMDRLDRIDGGDPFDDYVEVRITDYKTQWYPDWHRFQMRFYAALVALTWPTVEWVETLADHPRVCEERGMVRERWHRSELLDWFDDIMAAFRLRIEEPRREPVGGAGCQYCARRFECPESIVPGALVPANDAQATALCREWIRLEHGLDARKEALKVYLRDRVPLIVEDQSFGFHEPRSQGFRVTDVDQARAILLGLGFEKADEWVRMETRPIPAKTKAWLVQQGVAVFEPGRRITFDHVKAEPTTAAQDENE